jgi:phytoene/squalene synthetase
VADTPPSVHLPAMVRARDYRRFLAIQLAPRGARARLYAITAFAAELTEIPQKVREPLAGFMRFAWWREALAAMQAGAPARAHPVLEALAAAMPLPYAQLEAMIMAGQEQLEDGADDMQKMQATLDDAWRATPGGAEKPLRALALLPTQGRINPRHIFSLLWMGLWR